VETSVLSKRWRHLWTFIPVLNLNDSSFDDPSLFQCFVDHVLSRRDASTTLYVLNLVCQDELDDGYIVDTIIDYVTLKPCISNSIQVLSILAECVLGKLPQLSLCQSLTTLKLVDISAEITTFDFVSLQHLYLSDCRFELGMEQFLDPFKGCVKLKHLYLHGCQYYGEIERFKISAPELTHFSISWMRVDEQFDSDCVIELFTPKLQYFKYSDDSD
ncbi:F-box/LRR-repeat protein 13, partial [Mucuna pruriens]